MLIGICDDNRSFCEKLKSALISYSFKVDSKLAEFEIMIFNAPQKLLECKYEFDVIFLDIRFDKDDLGVELAKNLRKQGCKSFIIFLSSLPGHMQDGYKAEALRYLVKPLKIEELHEAMDTIIDKLCMNDFNGTRIAIKTSEGTEIVNIDKLVYIRSFPSTRSRHLIREGDEIITKEPLASIYERLPNNQFVYSNQSIIANLSYVKLIQKSMFITTTNTSLPISRLCKRNFIFAMGQFAEDSL